MGFPDYHTSGGHSILILSVKFFISAAVFPDYHTSGGHSILILSVKFFISAAVFPIRFPKF